MVKVGGRKAEGRLWASVKHVSSEAASWCLACRVWMFDLLDCLVIEKRVVDEVGSIAFVQRIAGYLRIWQRIEV